MPVMAITFNTDRLQGLEGTTISGVYARIQSVTVKKYDATTDPVASVQWRCLYDVVLHATAVKRNASGEYPEWGNRLRSRDIDHFTCTYDPASNSNPYAQAYADLKTKLAADSPPVASSIADA
jgi:hypothetical protein